MQSPRPGLIFASLRLEEQLRTSMPNRSVLQTPEGLENEKVDFIKSFYAVADDPQGLEQASLHPI
jgi:hypothetical protein